MLALHLSSLTNPLIGGSIAGACMVVTIAAALYVWRRPIDLHSTTFFIALLGLLAATGAVAWHSHIHTAPFLIPPLILLERQHILPKHTPASWVFIPALAFIIATMLASAIQADILPKAMGELPDFIRSFSEFALNLYLFF